MFEINKIIIIFIGVFLFTTAQAQVSWNTTTQIYARILNQNHLKWPRKLRLIKSNDMNAWADKSDTITVTSGLLRNATPAELAMVLGHEITHTLYKDAYHNDKGKLDEDRADFYGTIYATKIGYNHCDMAPFFYKLYKKYGNMGGEGDPHSSNITRYKRLNKGCNRGGG